MTCATELCKAENAAIQQWIDAARLAYITTTSAGDARKCGLIPADAKVSDETLLYLLHASDGRVLGFAEAWATAFGTARRNDLTLLSVH